MLADAMPQLVVAQAERLGGLALVPAVPAERVLDDGALVRLDRGAQIGDRIVVGRSGPLFGLLRRGVRRPIERFIDRLPRALERVEDDVADRILRVAPAID